jgi:hypothetical protein
VQRTKTLGLIAIPGNFGRFERLVTGTGLGVKEPEQFLQHCGIGRIPQKRAFTAHQDEILILELLQVMRQRL